MCGTDGVFGVCCMCLVMAAVVCVVQMGVFGVCCMCLVMADVVCVISTPWAK